MSDNKRLLFASDYMEGAHPAVMDLLMKTNLMKSVGYGLDEISESARDRIRQACCAPDADVHFLVGGTQANATVITSVLKPYQGVISSETGHVEIHEAGAIEFNGHKVLTIPHKDGKVSAADVRKYIDTFWDDDNHEHMVMPGMLYISHPTECGTLYTLSEMEELSALCREYDLSFFVDGARLSYALGCPENDVTLPDLARLCDVFYIGGTKCGALFGEAVVFPAHDYVPHFYTMTKQHGAMLAKGRILGVQFDALFTDDLYMEIGRNAIAASNRIREALISKGYEMAFETPTNQIFVKFSREQYERISENVELEFWEAFDDGSRTMRICTSWATTDEDVDRLIEFL